MEIKVAGKNLEVLKEFPVLYRGWDCDGTGYIVRDGNRERVVLTSHGSPYFAKIKELEEKISEYKNALQETEVALKKIKK